MFLPLVIILFVSTLNKTALIDLALKAPQLGFKLTVSWWSLDSPVSFMVQTSPDEGDGASADRTLNHPAPWARYLLASASY